MVVELDEALPCAIRAMQILAEEMCLGMGGYPAIVSDEVPGHVVVASVDENGRPGLTVYGDVDVVKWYGRARGSVPENPDDFNPEVEMAWLNGLSANGRAVLFSAMLESAHSLLHDVDVW